MTKRTTNKAIMFAGLGGLAYVLYQNRAKLANVLNVQPPPPQTSYVIRTPNGVSPMAVVTPTGTFPIGGVRPPISGGEIVLGDNPLRFRLA